MEEDNKNKLYSLFATPLLVTKKYIAEEKAKTFVQKSFDGQLTKNTFNFTSSETYILDNPELNNLKHFIEENLNFYFYEILKYKKHLKIYITQSWLNFNPKDSSHHMHFHKNSIFSGVYYFNYCDTMVNFTSPYPNPLTGNITDTHDLEEKNIFNTHETSIKDLQDKLIIFPSTILHSVSPNETNNVRVSLSFNTFIEGITSTDPNHLQRLNLKMEK